eukprot:jgi/Picsp_1/3121/NSC_05962-R1_protein
MRWTVPQRLIGLSPAVPRIAKKQKILYNDHNNIDNTSKDVLELKKRQKTVYTLRISTSADRGSSFDDTSSGILVCMIGHSGDAFLKYIPCLEDVADLDSQLRAMCLDAEDIPVGVDCSMIMGSPAPPRDGSNGYSRIRFQSGDVNEISIVGPDLGELEALIVGPQSGTWGCEEIVVSSSAEKERASTKFVCTEHRSLLGSDPMHSATYMFAVPLGTVVYGQGESAKILSASEALELAAKNMSWYNDMKKKLLFYTATVGIMGISLTYVNLGSAAAFSFATGTAASFIYQLGLQKRVDSIGKDIAVMNTDISPSSRNTGHDYRWNILSSLPFAGVSALLWWLFLHPDGLGTVHPLGNILEDAERMGSNVNFNLTLALVAGFASQKIAVIAFSVQGLGKPKVVNATLASSSEPADPHSEKGKQPENQPEDPSL